MADNSTEPPGVLVDEYYIGSVDFPLLLFFWSIAFILFVVWFLLCAPWLLGRIVSTIGSLILRKSACKCSARFTPVPPPLPLSSAAHWRH